MSAIFQISLNTFKETIRNKVLYNILLVAGVVLALSISFGELSVFSRVQVMTDFGLATLSLTGLLLSVFIGVGMLGMEITNKTVYGILTKPVSRNSFILGKFFGLLTTLLLNLFCIVIVFLLSIKFLGGTPDIHLLAAVLLIVVEMAVVISASIFFSSFTTPTLAAIFTIAFYVAGHLNDFASAGTSHIHNTFLKTILDTCYFILPNLEHFNIRTRVVFELPVSGEFVVYSVSYGLLYTMLLLILAMLSFSKKDL